MAYKDIGQKKLEDHEDVFADIVNVLMFDGEEIVKPEELTPALPRSIYKFDDKVHEQERDTAKFWNKSELHIAFIGLENQSKSDSDMVMRVFSYDGAAYRAQLNADEEGKPKQRFPVVTLTLYFGYEYHWRKYRRLKECFETPAPLEPFVNDYKLNLVEVAWLPDETIAKFKSDFKLFANYLVQMRKTGEYVPPSDRIKHVEEVLNLFHAFTGDDRFEQAQNERIVKEARTMKSFLSEAWEKGEAKGRAEGRAEGKAEGKAEGRAEGKAEGRAEGKAEGRAEGKQKVFKLLELMMKDGKFDEVKQIINDETKREEYFIAYGLNG